MPQFNPADWVPQIIWLVITFTLLYLLMAKVALPKVGGVLDARRNKIEGDLSKADELRKATDNAIAAYEQALAEAKQEAHAIAQEARDSLDKELSAEQEKIESELAKKAEEAEARIAEAKASALKEVDGIATEVAADIVDRLIGVTPAKAETEKAVASAKQE